MKDFLLNLLPRLGQFSESLDKKETLVDQTWVLVDDKLNKYQYIFQRDGTLLVAFNGEVKTGKWQYIAPARSLLIDIGDAKTLYKQAFVDKGLLILKKDSFKEEPWLLINERIIPDLDADRYMKEIISSKLNYRWEKLIDGNELQYISPDGFSGLKSGMEVSFDGRRPEDGIYQLTYSGKFVEIKNSQVVRIFDRKEYATDKGILIIETPNLFVIAEGNAAFLGSVATFAPDGIYFLQNDGSIKEIEVREGEVVKIRRKKDNGTLIVSIILFLGVTFFILMMANRSGQQHLNPSDKDNISREKQDTGNRMQDTGNRMQYTGNRGQYSGKTMMDSGEMKRDTFARSPAQNSDDDIRRRVVHFIDLINGDDMGGAQSLLSPTVKRYFNSIDLKAQEVVNEIHRYRTEVVAEDRTIVAMDSLSVKGIPGGYEVRGPVTDLSTLRKNGIPYIFTSENVFLVGHDLVIYSVSGNVLDRRVDRVRILGLNPFAGTETQKESFNEIKFGAIFRRLSGTTYPSAYKNALKAALLTYCNTGIPVYNAGKVDMQKSLGEFCDVLIAGTVIFEGVKQVENSGGNVTRLEVWYTDK